MGKHMLKLLLAGLFALLGSINAGAAEIVRVGAYPFLPFVDKGSGLTFELLQAMNAFQKEYQFELVDTSPNRRYQDMASGNFSMMLFENVKWGWDAAAVDVSKVYLRGDGEVYVARSAPGRGESYFDVLTDKQLLLVLGYHYGFANFESDQLELAKKYKISFSFDNAVSLRNLLMGRGDVAVITRSYLTRYLVQNPQDAEKLLVSLRMDQTYAHTALIKKGSKPTVQEIDALLDRMEAAGVLKKLWANYGIKP